MGSGLQVCLSSKAGRGNKFGKDSNPGLMRAILESAREDDLPATGYAKAVAGNVINILVGAGSVMAQIGLILPDEENAAHQRFGCKSAVIRHS